MKKYIYYQGTYFHYFYTHEVLITLNYDIGVRTEGARGTKLKFSMHRCNPSPLPTKQIDEYFEDWRKWIFLFLLSRYRIDPPLSLSTCFWHLCLIYKKNNKTSFFPQLERIKIFFYNYINLIHFILPIDLTIRCVHKVHRLGLQVHFAIWFHIYLYLFWTFNFQIFIWWNFDLQNLN